MAKRVTSPLADLRLGGEDDSDIASSTAWPNGCNRSGLGGRGDGYPLVGMLTRTGCARMRSYRLRVRCQSFRRGAEPDVLFWLGSFRVPVVAPTALGGPDTSPA